VFSLLRINSNNQFEFLRLRKSVRAIFVKQAIGIGENSGYDPASSTMQLILVEIARPIVFN